MKKFFGLLLLLIILAFAFQGSRGIWEPDEGYYIGIARDMVETGDWIVPQLNLRPFLDKPPIVYWGSAFMMDQFGFNEWSARIPHSVWFLLTAVFVYLLGKDMFDEKTGILSALIYATSPIPFVAANIVTPDTPLTVWVSAMFLGFWKVFRSQSKPRRLMWEFFLGVSGGLAFLSKGPATFVYMAPVFFFLLASGNLKAYCLRWGFLMCSLLFVAVGASWYVAVIYYIPGALHYFLESQVTGRLFTEEFNRNPEWYTFTYVYLPVVLFGTLPWSVAWLPRIIHLYKNRGFEKKPLRQWDRRTLFLSMLVIVPFVIFCSASSKLPLYILPLFAPLSLISALCWIRWKPDWIGSNRPLTVTLFFAFWVILLVTVRGGMAYWPTDRDTRAFWEEVKDKIPKDRSELVVVNMRRRGLGFYTDYGVEMVTTKSNPYPAFTETERLSEEVHELPTCGHHHVFFVRDREYEEALELIQNSGATYNIQNGPEGVHIITVDPASPEVQVVRLAALGDTRTGDSGQIQLGSALYHTDETNPLNGIVLLGDNISFRGEPEYFEDHFVRPYDALLDAGVSFFAVLGNHDIKGGFSSFQLNHPYLNMKGRRYYSEMFGEELVECFMLDTNTIVGDPQQISWLNKSLQESPATWKIVAMHEPLYGAIERRPEADEQLRERLEPIFVKGGVDLALSGHNHVYQRRVPVKGIHYFTAGSGGKLDRGQNLPDDPGLVVGNDETNVALILEFDEKECRFKAINVLEQVVDEGVIPKEDSGHIGKTETVDQ
ncbi:MAG: glycosyltransferase family 39 protein [Candidatus Omnitrophica bacterium]|nr:glycosyltransferase family 39 protein [Candidatus Omnitrophota bacterium]MCB9783761.1 glycosyltransferase family 39 protein [Candidatus Omnitrophota bacterium]